MRIEVCHNNNIRCIYCTELLLYCALVQRESQNAIRGITIANGLVSSDKNRAPDTFIVEY